MIVTVTVGTVGWACPCGWWRLAAGEHRGAPYWGSADDIEAARDHRCFDPQQALPTPVRGIWQLEPTRPIAYYLTDFVVRFHPTVYGRY